MNSQDLLLIVPEMIVAAVASAILLLAALSRRDNRWLVLALALTGNMAAAGYSLQYVLPYVADEPLQVFSGQLTIDRFMAFFGLLFLVVSAATIVLAVDQLERIPYAEFVAVVLFSTTGMMLLAGATDLVMIFVAVELMAIPVYILTAFTRVRLVSTEAAIKYFTMGAFATAVLAYGLAWTYGLTGKTSLAQIGEVLAQVRGDPAASPAILLAAGLVLVAAAFKIAAVPFHAWTPDAYDGAPTPVSAFMSIGPKIAAMAMLVRLIGVAFVPLVENVHVLLYVLAAVTIVAGNIWAVQQTNIKRMLAYSSIAHSGYMLAGIAAVTQADGGPAYSGFHTLMFYAVAYALMNVGAFAVAFAIEKRTGSVEIAAFRGLARQSWMPALMMTVFMLALTGVPPLAGFFAKLFIIQALVSSDLTWLAIILVVASVVSAYYYLRVVAYMFMRDPEPAAAVEGYSLSDSMASVVFLAGAGTLALGIFSNWLYRLALLAADSVTQAAL